MVNKSDTFNKGAVAAANVSRVLSCLYLLFSVVLCACARMYMRICAHHVYVCMCVCGWWSHHVIAASLRIVICYYC